MTEFPEFLHGYSFKSSLFEQMGQKQTSPEQQRPV